MTAVARTAKSTTGRTTTKAARPAGAVAGPEIADMPVPADLSPGANTADSALPTTAEAPMPDPGSGPDDALPGEFLPDPDLTVRDDLPDQIDLRLEPDRLPKPEPEPVPVSRSLPPPSLPRPAPPLPPVQVTTQRIGFAPLVVGGIVAAGLGFGAAYIWQRDASAAQRALMVTQSAEIAALSVQVAALPAPVDLTPVLDRLATDATAIADLQSSLTATLATLDARLIEVEKAPNSDGTLSETAIAAWERELDDLRTEIGVQQARMQELAAAAAVQLDQTRSEAASIEKDAADIATDAAARSALSRVQAALDSGVPFDAALGDLGLVVEVPAALSDVATTGLPTIMTLQAEFPDAARAALAIARSEGLAGEEGGGLAAFLRNQFDVRSVTPQDGTTADAVLSRAEDALRQNRLSDALAEVASLPEVVRVALSGWTTAAESRAAALAAAEALSLSLTEN